MKSSPKAEKIIIINTTDKPMQDVLHYVQRVVRKGRVSADGKAYTYAAGFSNGVLVVTKRNAASDTFIISQEESE